ncbi:MAG TPA: hypothetical protein VFL95_05480 [Gemmatimonadales bacterium]|nr:hypothetical protein [Gemmatimonadales bacterium]
MRLTPLLALSLGAVSPLAAQQSWNSPEALRLVRRAVQRREAVQADTALRSYRTTAHGFVFFLAQVGEGLSEPPRLVKADQLNVEVYWRAPDQSKQVILGWRDGTWLPTDINYHRDHLGIVTNNFGDRIRIGEGDEVRDVVHPLSPAGLDLYDFALRDSLSLQAGADRVLVKEVQVRPRDFSFPAVVGTLYIDAATAELVRFRFSFTPSSYLDKELEDINIVLENSLWQQKYWLPHRQEVEIRRRTTWLDFPARGIIRGRWEIDDYDFNVPLPDGLFRGPAIAGLRKPGPPTDTTWSEPLAEAVAGVARPLNDQDMAALRVEVERIAGDRLLSGLPRSRLAIGAVSDLVHINRVQGLALGIGANLGVGDTRLQLQPGIGIGTADGRVTGEFGIEYASGATQLTLRGNRAIRDFSDWPVMAPVLNSFTAQEAGDDHGDYVLLNRAALGVRYRLSGRTAIGAELVLEESRSVGVSASPARGSYDSNPELGAGSYRIGRLRLERTSGGIAVRHDFQGALQLEGGDGPTRYLRADAEGRWLTRLAGNDLVTRIHAGAATDGVPSYRAFVMGGRGTLVGEPFRAYGGSRAALLQVEWRFDVPVPAIPLGSFASTGRRATLAPFIEAGWTDGTAGRGAMVGVPTDGVRPVAGVALEWFMRLIRVEAGVGLRDGHFGLTVDVNREWWGLL